MTNTQFEFLKMALASIDKSLERIADSCERAEARANASPSGVDAEAQRSPATAGYAARETVKAACPAAYASFEARGAAAKRGKRNGGGK